MFRILNRCLAFLLALVVFGATTGRADEPKPPKDDALDRLLEKLDKPAPAPTPAPPDAKPQSEPAKGEAAKPDRKAGDAAKPPAEVAPKDRALDNLLEKLSESSDKPTTEAERKTARPMPGEEPKEQTPPKPGPRGPQDLTGKGKDLDEHLEELTGRKRKKKSQDDEGSGPLSQVIKEMREVEQRLGKPDTGEETRKRQTEIVKNLDQVIEQLRNSSAQSKGQKSRIVMQPGQKPGSQPGETPGANANGPPSTKPAKPDGKHSTAGGKDIWGHLPDELRQEMDNVAREVMLPSKEELIRLYYLSVSKKSLTREE